MSIHAYPRNPVPSCEGDLCKNTGGPKCAKETTEQPPVLNENTLCHVEAHGRSTHSSPSCRDLIKMRRSCCSWPAVLFDAGHGLGCQILSNQLSCFSGKKHGFFFLFWGCFVQSFAPVVEFSWAPGQITHTTVRACQRPRVFTGVQCNC